MPRRNTLPALLIPVFIIAGCSSAAPRSDPQENAALSTSPPSSAPAIVEQVGSGSASAASKTAPIHGSSSSSGLSHWYPPTPTSTDVANPVASGQTIWTSIVSSPCADNLSAQSGATPSVLTTRASDTIMSLLYHHTSNIAPMTNPIATTTASFSPLSADDAYEYAANQIRDLLTRVPSFKAADAVELTKRERGRSMKEILDLRLLVLRTLLNMP